MRRILIEARGVTKAYTPGAAGPGQADTRVLRGVDLALPEGDFAAILGPPGAGKSTLLRVLGFVEPPSGGQLLWHGRLVTGLSPEELACLREQSARELLLVDEPTAAGSTGGLDPPPVVRQLRSLNQAGQSIILATADPEIALWCTTIYRMKDGQLRILKGGT